MALECHGVYADADSCVYLHQVYKRTPCAVGVRIHRRNALSGISDANGGGYNACCAVSCAKLFPVFP